MLVLCGWAYQAGKRREKLEEIASRQKAGGDMGDPQPSPEEVQLSTASVEHCLCLYCFTMTWVVQKAKKEK